MGAGVMQPQLYSLAGKELKMTEQPVSPEPKYTLELTDNDKIALVNIINQTTFKGQDVEYVSELKVRVSEAPLSANKAPSKQGDPK
jgi:hypothetical protein